jgi:hypothetical protein
VEATLKKCVLGKSGLEVSALGFGRIGNPRASNFFED